MVASGDLVTHGGAVWGGRADSVVRARLDEAVAGGAVEELLSTRSVGDRVFEVCCIPFFAQDVALGDLVEVDEHFLVRRVVARSGRWVFRAALESPDQAARECLSVDLARLGSMTEWSSSRRVAIDAGDPDAAARVLDHLQREEDQGVLMYESSRQAAVGVVPDFADLTTVRRTHATEETPLLAALQRVGVEIESIWSLGEQFRGREDVARVLVEFLQGSAGADLFRGRVAQAVAQVKVRDVWLDLAALYRVHPGELEAYGLAVALVACAGSDRLGELEAMVRDESFGTSRVAMIAAVSRRLGDRGDDLLQDYVDHPELGVEASAVLGRRLAARKRRTQKPNH